MTRVAFDHQIFERQVFGGISRYCVRIAEAMARKGDVAVSVVSPLSVNAYLRSSEVPLLKGATLPSFRGAGRCAAAVNKVLAGPALTAFGPDVVHETYYSPHPSGRPRRARVLTVHDMIHEKFPQMFPSSDTTVTDKAAAVRRADHVFCVSESTRRDLLELFPEIENRCTVTHLGVDRGEPSGAAVATGDRPYILYVGHRDGYKNFSGLLEAYAASGVLRQLGLIAVGGGGFKAEEKELMAKLGVGDRVTRLDASDGLLRSLYAHAALFVYPSLYEGFGIPPLEAMAAGCPVVCVRTSSVPEVCGDAAEYAETGTGEELRAAIERVLLSSDRSDALRRAGRERSATFSWERCATETQAGYARFA